MNAEARVLKSRILTSAGLVLAAFLLYAGTFDHPFVFDDLHSIVDNPHIKDLSRIPSYLSDPQAFSATENVRMYRPLLLITYALNYRLGGLDPAGWHAINILLHGLCAALVAQLAWALGRAKAITVPTANLWVAALVAGGLFLVHPLASEPVNYISARSGLLAALFFLLAVWLHSEGRVRENRLWVWLGPLVFALSLMSKEETIVLVVLIPLIDALVLKPQGQRHDYPLWAAYLAVAIAYLLLRKAVLGASFSQTPVRPAWDNLLTQTKALVIYLKLLVLPTGLNAGRDLPVETGLLNPRVLSAIALLGTLTALAITQWRQRPLITLCAAWFLLTLAPTSSIIPLNQIMAERRMYLPLAGFALLVAGFVASRNAKELDKAGLAIAAALLLALGGMTAMRNRVWATDLSLFSDMVAKAPTQYLNHFGVARALKQRGDYEGALAAYEKGLALKPDDPEMLNNVGNLYREWSEDAARPEAERRELEARAEARYRRAIELKPSYSIALNNLGSFYADRKRYEEARNIYEAGTRSNPHFWAGHVNLGKIEALAGNPEAAISHYQTALRLNPEMPQRDGVQAEIMRLALETGDTGLSRKVALERLQALDWEKDATDALLQAYTRTLTPSGEPDVSGLILLRERLAEKYPDLWQNWGSLASLCQVQGAKEKAARYYRRSLETGAQSPWREQIETALRQMETVE